ncbi:MAG TPA: prolyl oligopeptidase family serine peptidase [Terriglobales bacterium]|nr:prolyl oligopeptidase family serine peptidase [Terriglobales bacterium]
MPKTSSASLTLAVILGCLSFSLAAQGRGGPAAPPDPAAIARQQQANQQAAFQAVQKTADDVLWHLELSDIADVDKVWIPSDAPIRMANPTAQGAGNPLLFHAYTFIPKKLAPDQKAPLLVYVHEGVHSSMDTSQAHIVRELVGLGYVIVAPEYRGSTGYGAGFESQIDYGGAEVVDVHSARDWAVANLAHVDPARVGIIGWSHGGYQTLLNIFKYPKDYVVAYAGVPVSDLVMRMGYKSQSYRDIYSGFLGKTADQDPMEYRRRSPYFHAAELQTPLLIHTNTNDEDVNVMEVEHLIDALKAAGKQSLFQYKIYQNAPGGHYFNRIDTAFARQSRQEVYKFLDGYLHPGH